MRILPRKAEIAPIVLIVFGYCGLGYIAYAFLGGLGLAILGLFSGNILMNVELQRGGAIGHIQAAGIYAQQMAQDATSADRAERRAEMQQSALPKNLAKLMSLGLIVVGFGMFLAALG